MALHLSVDLFVSIVGKGSFKSNCSRRHNMERRDKQIDSNHLSRTPLNKGTHDMLWKYNQSWAMTKTITKTHTKTRTPPFQQGNAWYVMKVQQGLANGKLLMLAMTKTITKKKPPSQGNTWHVVKVHQFYFWASMLLSFNYHNNHERSPNRAPLNKETHDMPWKYNKSGEGETF